MNVQYVPPHDVDCTNLQKVEGGATFTPISSGRKLPLGYIVVTEDNGAEYRHRMFLLPSGNVQSEKTQTKPGTAAPQAAPVTPPATA